MENQRFMQEGIDGKRVLLLFGKKIWLFAVAAFVGAVLGGGIYLLVHLLSASQREYEAVSKIYLNFSCAPEDFNELSYNGYTWNDLMATDPILDYTMENLPPEIDRETVIGATKAEILSDIRLLTITITANTPELAAQIMEATQIALVHLGETDELFESIEIYSTVEPRQIVWDNRTARAAVTGMVIALFAVLVAAAFYYVMDDSVYVAEDVERRYGIPGIGVLAEEKWENAKSYDEELLANYCYLGRDKKAIALVSVDSAADAERAGERMQRLLAGDGVEGRVVSTIDLGDKVVGLVPAWKGFMRERHGYENGNSCKGGSPDDSCQEGDGRKGAEEESAASESYNHKECHNNGECRNFVYGMPEEDTGIYAKLREADGVVVAVRFGAGNGKRMERLLGNLRKQDCKVLGAVITDADESFLRMYYMGRSAGRRNRREK